MYQMIQNRSQHFGQTLINRARAMPEPLSLRCGFVCRTTIWSLVDKKCTYLRGTKHSDKGLAFSPNGHTLAILEVGTNDAKCKKLYSVQIHVF